MNANIEDYKKDIIKMLDKICSLNLIIKIHTYVKTLYLMYESKE